VLEKTRVWRFIDRMIADSLRQLPRGGGLSHGVWIMSTPVVLITGALAGIGRATAIAFGNEGARLVVSGRREDAGNALAVELRGLGAEAEFIRADVRHEDDMRRLVGLAVARFGRLDVAVNNAGTEGNPGPLTEMTSDSYAAMFDTNVLGTLFGLKHELRVMQAQGSGSIVNISSTFGERGGANMSLYAGSKHAIEGITKSAAIEAAASGVRINAVAPGPTDTAMLDRLAGSPEKKAAFYAAIPLKRNGTPDEVADAITFLASDKARFITGQVIRVNGGKTAS
jgi:NAD(P)-dependent dehydrogenase (short-subunit alcohol dehydrogenase family)